MKQLIFCNHKTYQDSSYNSRQIAKDEFVFSNLTQLRGFLKDRLKVDGELHEYGGPRYETLSEAYKKIKKQFDEKGSWSLIFSDEEGFHWYTIKIKEWREFHEPKPKRKIGDRWTVKRYGVPVRIQWKNWNFCSINIQYKDGSVTFWPYCNPEKALQRATNHIRKRIKK